MQAGTYAHDGKYIPSPEQRTRARLARIRRRAAQPPKRCKKHPEADAQLFAIAEPGRHVKHEYLCIECASVLIGIHGATLALP